MSILKLVWRYRTALVIALAVIGFACAFYGYGREQRKAGAAEVQAKWNADKAARNAETDRALRSIAARVAETKARNEEVINGYQKQISNIAADRDSIAGRLRDNEVRLRALSEAANQPRADGSPAQPESPRSVDEALDAYDRACRSDAAQLEALIRQLRGQLDKPVER